MTAQPSLLDWQPPPHHDGVVKVIHPRFQDYFIRSDGQVERRVDSCRKTRAGDLIYGRVLVSGYRQFNLRENGRQVLIRGNRLVCEAFHGPAPSREHQAAHRNGNRLDNQPSNLYWATPKENNDDKYLHGTIVFGEKSSNQHGAAKMTIDLVRTVRAEYSGKRGDITRIARRYAVSPSCIFLVVHGISWRHVA